MGILELTQMKTGAAGVVAAINAKDPQKLRKLMAMGVLPGTPIKLIRKFPSYVFQLGFTQIAVDQEIAKEITVKID